MNVPKTSHFFSKAGLAALAAGALVTLSPKPSHAEQFTLFDVTFNFTWDDAMNSSPSKSHYYVKSDKLNPQRPTNWVAPIDYRTGKVHIYLEVLEKPAGGQMQGWALCYVGGGGYGCPYTKYYTEKGIYENEVDMTSFFNNNQIGWTQGINEVDLVYTINGSGSGHVTNFPDLKDKTTPTKVRIAMVQLSKGTTYDPSMLPNTGGNMGGAGGMGGMGGAGGAATGGGGAGGAPGMAGSGGGGGANVGGQPTAGAAGTTVLPTGGTAPSSGGAGGSGPSVGGSTITSPLSSTSDDGGCALGRRPGSVNLAWLALSALGLLWRKRAKRSGA